MGKLSGKVAVVTGASKGIGAAIAKAYGAEGAAVVVNYHSDKAGAERVVESIRQAGGKAVAVAGDVSRKADVEKLFAEAKKAFGQLDVLVNNAGIYEFRPLEQIDEAHFRKHFDLNVLGLELGPRKIRVNALSPGFTETEGVQSNEATKQDSFAQYAVQRTPLGRTGQLEDIAKAAVFLASDDSAWITGEVVPVGGGIRL